MVSCNLANWFLRINTWFSDFQINFPKSDDKWELNEKLGPLFRFFAAGIEISQVVIVLIGFLYWLYCSKQCFMLNKVCSVIVGSIFNNVDSISRYLYQNVFHFKMC